MEFHAEIYMRCFKNRYRDYFWVIYFHYSNFCDGGNGKLASKELGTVSSNFLQRKGN